MIQDTKCEIITVGTELLLGQIVDTNSAWLAEKLANMGINLYYKQTVGDNFDRLFSVFKKAQKRSNIIFVTGGLGPTDDDLTRDVAAKLFNCELNVDQTSLDKIKSYFQSRNLTMTENNVKQALSFEGGSVFQNLVGMAPGLHYEYDGALWFFLPGVPKEMKWIVEEEILPFLKSKKIASQPLYSKVLSFSGIGESILETKLQDLIRQQTNPTIAPLAGEGYVNIRLTAKASSYEEGERLIDPIEKEILNRVGSFFTGYGQVPLEIALMKQLKDMELTLSSCESLTGGLFASTIVQHDGASSVFNGSLVAYNNEIKNQVVGVPSRILENEGAVSEACAKEMAEQTRLRLSSDLSISFTGVAGTKPVDGQSSGTVYVGISSVKTTEVHQVQINGDRNTIREAAVKEGTKLLMNFLKKF